MFGAIKKFFLPLGILQMLFLYGCVRVNTNALPIFEEVQHNIHRQSGYCPHWNTDSYECNDQTWVTNALEQELTLDLAISIALLNNKELQAIYENLGIAKAQFVQAGLLNNPIFSLSYRFSTQSSVTNLIDLGLFQNFLEILLIPLKKRVAAAELEATKARVTAQIFDVIAQTKIAFFTYQAVVQIWGLKKQILLGADSSFEAGQKLFKAGNIKKLELTEQYEFYEKTKVEVADLELEVLKARERLNVLMGLWGPQIHWKAHHCIPFVQEKEGEWEDVENKAISNSFDLAIAKKGIYAAAAGFGIDTTRIVFPQFELGPSSERDEGTWYVGPALALGLPFFDFGQAVSANAQSEILRQWKNYTALAIEIRSEARMKRMLVLNAHRKALYYQKVLIPIAEQLTSLTLLQHNAMQLGVFHLLAAKMHEIEQKIHNIELIRDYWIARTELEILLNGHLIGKVIEIRR
ncbi:MAG: TolC family protein [Chlamydiia bacterium]|nr:TolC family protein [Chlamydiia bacterium]